MPTKEVNDFIFILQLIFDQDGLGNKANNKYINIIGDTISTMNKTRVRERRKGK